MNKNLLHKNFKDDEIYKFDCFDISVTEKMNTAHFLNKNLMIHLIEHFENFDEINKNNGWRLIHYICMYSTPEIIQYIIDKGVDLECQTNNGWRPTFSYVHILHLK